MTKHAGLKPQQNFGTVFSFCAVEGPQRRYCYKSKLFHLTFLTFLSHYHPTNTSVLTFISVLCVLKTFFEALEVPAFYVTLPAILSCYAMGRVSAMMLDIGDSVSHILPIYEGKYMQKFISAFKSHEPLDVSRIMSNKNVIFGFISYTLVCLFSQILQAHNSTTVDKEIITKIKAIPKCQN